LNKYSKNNLREEVKNNKMKDLPKKFPEYSLMYKNLNKKIRELKTEQENIEDEIKKNEIQIKIETYQKEMDKIKSIFPDDFFDNDF
jgi:chromosome segregation ATPase